MIISGSVQSLMGGIPIEELKAGDTVIDTHQCPRKVESVEPVSVSGGISFDFCPSLVVTPGSRLFTVYGEKEAVAGQSYTIKTEGGMEISETLRAAGARQAYRVKVKGAGFIYANGYGVEVEEC